MIEYDLQEEQIKEYFATAQERYSIMLRRRDGSPKPWSDDQVFRNWRFCNVFREDDKVTEWIRKNVREPLQNNPKVITAMAACRIFNRIATLERLDKAHLFIDWNAAECRRVMAGVTPVVGAAYVVKTPDGMDKLNGCIEMVDAFQRDAANVLTHLASHQRGPLSLEQVWTILQRFPCIGPFMAYEIVSDLRHTYLLKDAWDVCRWACPGPGAARGLSWIHARNMTAVPYGGKKASAAAIKAMRILLLHSTAKSLWPADWPRWEMREVEHWLCEYAKYAKVKHLRKTMKVRYQGA